jgi:hypothetical protein
MGEYVNYGGTSIKLGTCEDLYYVRHEQLERIIGRCAFQAGNLQPRQYLNPAHGWRYRFPFPQEDGIEPGTFKDFDYGMMLSVPKDSPFLSGEHETICQSISCSGTHNVNTIIPCPASDAFKGIKSSGVPDCRPVEIVQQKLMEDGSLWTVLRCGWCKAKYRLPRDEAVTLAEVVRNYDMPRDDARRKFFDAIADRIMAGYDRVPALA